MIMRSLQDFLFHVVRAFGGFRVAQHLTRNRLRILCYHGFSAGDEHEVQPHMFMRAATFERRLQILKKRALPVISLDEAVGRMATGEIRRGEVVITIDDGWASTLTIAAPILERYGHPACVYVTTEHLAAGTEVFNVALYYMICRSPHTQVRLEGVHPELDGTYDLRTDPHRTTTALIEAAARAFPVLGDRQRALPRIAAALAMNLDDVLDGGRFRLLSQDQLRELAARGAQIELHTHSHNLPDRDFESAAAEIEQNRAELKAVLGRKASHFCFPSGRYSKQHPEWLERLGIASATTCDPGLNLPGTPIMLLKRYLDSDSLSDIAFEARVSGFREVAHEIASLLSLRRRRGAAATLAHD